MFRICTLVRLLLVLSTALAIGSGLSGCATGGARTSAGAPVGATAGANSHVAAPVADPFAAFAAGEIRLSCKLACAGSDGASRRKYRALYQDARWRDLALEVVSVGYYIDRNYFYLGRAAEGLGFKEAARIYYRLALQQSYKCGGSINVCDGFSFPSDVVFRENVLDRQAAQELAARQAAENAARIEAQKKADQAAAARQASENAARIEAQKKADQAAAARQATDQNKGRSAAPVPGQAAGRSGSVPDFSESASSSAVAPKKPAPEVRSLTDL